ncbi:hypothetical protein TWF191_005826 [Orbilia oligospora]|uniref:Uncharacterized protein n=1 Tax=Orbilia oligospora TaxID=2813651 RepID=A0A7C8UXJ6_ORBOL|nr:hypothetical protein TWF191_005826 [Orbilia oligospora]
MSPPPLENTASEETGDKQTKPEPEGPNFNKIHGQVNPILHGARYVNGQIIEFSNVSSGTAQQFKSSHPAGEALAEALRSKFTMWIWDSFKDIGGISRSISKDFQMLSYCHEVILFPRPWDHQKEEEKITFKIQEIFGESFDFRFDESDIPEDMEFVLDVKGLRKHMQENRNVMNLWAV